MDVYKIAYFVPYNNRTELKLQLYACEYTVNH